MTVNSERFQKAFPELRVPKNAEERKKILEIVRATIEGNLYQLQDSMKVDRRQGVRRSQRTEDLSIILSESFDAARRIGYRELGVRRNRGGRQASLV